VAADEGGGKSRGDAEQASDADDLDALAGGLGSLGPNEGADEAEDEAHDLAALGALAARTTLASPESDDASLRLSPGGTHAAAPIDSPSARAAADQPVHALAASATKGASIAASEAASSAVLPDATPADARTRAALAAALTAPAIAPARARAAWVMPLLVGIGVGVGIAGVTYGLSRRDDAQPADHAQTAVPADPPTAANAAPIAAAPAIAAVVPAAHAAPVPTAPAPAPPVGEKPAPSAPHANVAARTQPAASAASAPASAPQTPVITVQPAQAAPEDPSLEAVAEAADKPATTMDALLDEALSPKARRDELAARQQAALEANAIPSTPSREQVTQAMTVLLPAIRGCAMGQSGLATAGIVVHSDGRVASVDVAGAPFAGSASGRCMEGVIRRARFPHFSQPSFRIKFPLAIQ